jgi:hypothetical protein
MKIDFSYLLSNFLHGNVLFQKSFLPIFKGNSTEKYEKLTEL